MIDDVSHSIADFETEPTHAGRPAGSAPGGRIFEGIVRSELLKLISHLTKGRLCELYRVFTCDSPNCNATSTFALTNPSKGRAIITDLSYYDNISSGAVTIKNRELILTSYEVEDLYEPHLQDLERKGHVPTDPNLPYAGSAYSSIYQGKKTEFDGLFAFVEVQPGGCCTPPDCPREKIFSVTDIRSRYLVEIKSAKSTNKSTIDGNAHERFAFQNMEYLNISLFSPETNLLLMANSAYVRYKNKYHPAFGVHAHILSSRFPSYKFQMICTAKQYKALLTDWLTWLL